jgi:hypothetical protein
VIKVAADLMIPQVYYMGQPNVALDSPFSVAAQLSAMNADMGSRSAGMKLRAKTLVVQAPHAQVDDSSSHRARLI